MSWRDFFLTPDLVWALALVPALSLALRWLDRRSDRDLSRIVGARLATLAGRGRDERPARRSLFLWGLTAAIIAAMQPAWGDGRERAEPRGVDIVVCLDVSRSMLARDLEPSRLGRARAEIASLLEAVAVDRVGLVAFAGEARLVTPLTRDHHSLAEILSQVDPLSVRKGGTDLGQALERAGLALRSAEGDQAAIILVSDGEDHERRGLEAARDLARRGIVVHALALGSSAGAKIPVATEDGEVFLKDATGRDIVTRPEPGDLMAIADATGGSFRQAQARRGELLEILDRRIRPLARRSLESERFEHRENRFQWFLCAALILWMLEFALTDRSPR